MKQILTCLLVLFILTSCKKETLGPKVTITPAETDITSGSHPQDIFFTFDGNKDNIDTIVLVQYAGNGKFDTILNEQGIDRQSIRHILPSNTTSILAKGIDIDNDLELVIFKNDKTTAFYHFSEIQYKDHKVKDNIIREVSAYNYNENAIINNHGSNPNTFRIHEKI